MPAEINQKMRLHQETLNSYVEEYREFCDTWRHLEDKAQGTITISGIFLAALFAFVSGLVETNGLFDAIYEKALLIIAALLLTLSVIYAIGVLRLKEVKTPPRGDWLNKMFNDFLESDVTDTEQRLPYLIKDQISQWQKVNEETFAVNLSKAKNLFRAQALLIAAIVAVMILTLDIIIKYGG